MIGRIRKIKDYRSFQDWNAPSDLPGFQALNLIYGINGSGKSTVASLLRDTQQDVEWSSGLEVDVIDHSGSSRRVNQASDVVWQTIRVFNREYVNENLSFEEDSGGTAQPLLVLGKENVDKETQRKVEEAKLAEANRELPDIDTQVRQTTRSRDQLLTTQARVIASELGSVGGRYAERSYDAGTIRRQLQATGKPEGQQVGDVASDLSLVQEQPSPLVPLPGQAKISVRSLADQTAKVLRETATSKVVPELVEHPDWQHWVETGISLHSERDNCIYCNGELSAERSAQLAAHFDESLRRLQEKVSGLLDELEGVRNDCNELLAGLPHEGELFNNVRKGYRASLVLATEDQTELSKAVSLLVAALNKKLGSLFSPQELDIGEALQELDLSKVTNSLKKHNEISADLESKRQEAALRVEQARVTEIRPVYEEAVQALSDLEKRRSQFVKQKRLAEAELERLGHDTFDPHPLARKLNDDLAQLLGRDDLKFVVQGTGYRIERDGHPALHLSEGERNSISLLYFLCSLNSHGTKASDCIVVIDDPVSSLDGNALAGASAHLWSELVGAGKCRQMFLLTHNFELFRMWSSQLDHSGRHIQQKHETFETRIKVVRGANGHISRQPLLVAWPTDTKLRNRLRSEYHYLFWRVANTLIECRANPTPEGDIEAATVLPNVCRRLLEGFLGFKSPVNVGNLHDQVMDVGSDEIPKATRTRIYRFVQAYSHNPEADTTRPVGRPEGVEILNTVLEFIREVDSAHFKAMCAAVDIEESLLAAAVVPSLPGDPGLDA